MTKLSQKQIDRRQQLREQRSLDSKVGRLKRTLMYIDVSHLSYLDWVRYRVNYIGGSDAPTILPGNLNPYQSRLELFHEKIGVVTKTGDETEATYSGHVLENHVVDNYWIWHDMNNPTHEQRMANINLGKTKGRQRYCRRVKDFIIYDPKFPHLQINIDGFIQNTRFEKAPRGILEVKSGLSYVWNEYEAEIPVFYIIQVQVYMLVTGLKYCEVAVLLDGRYFKVFPFWANKAIQDRILEETTTFWQLVLEGKQIWNDPDLTETEKLHYISQIEPPVDNTNALDKYLKERFRSSYKVGKMLINNEPIKIEIGEEILTTTIADASKRYLSCNEILNNTDKEKTLWGNALRKVFLDNKVDEIVNDAGQVLISHRQTTPGKTPSLRVDKIMADLEVA